MKKLFFSWPLVNSILDEYALFEKNDKGVWVLVGKEYMERKNDSAS